MKEQFVSYAQCHEDILLYHAFHDLPKGFYVDVGANDPIELSVTKALQLRGWRGVNVEPLKEKYDLLCADRPLDLNVCCGAGSREDELTFRVDGMLTSCDPKAMDAAPLAEMRTLPVRRLSDILLDCCPDNTDIHLCKIDVEGFEEDVLRGIDFARHRPWVFVLETLINDNPESQHTKWEPALLEKGYLFARQVGMNRYYCALEHADLAARILSVEQLGRLYDLRFVVAQTPEDVLARRFGGAVFRRLPFLRRGFAHFAAKKDARMY